MFPGAESRLGRRSALALVAAPALTVLTSAATHVAPSSAGESGRPARPHLAWVVGDSITVLGRSALRQRLASSVGEVEINAVSGRSVARLDTLVEKRLARGDHPNVMVLALGTNPSPGWHGDAYERVVGTIPDGVAVVLVTVYRSDKSELPAAVRPMQHYSRAMRRVAGVRANVCTAPWRAAASQHPGSLLIDGVHPTARGSRVWADLIGDAVDRSWRSMESSFS